MELLVTFKNPVYNYNGGQTCVAFTGESAETVYEVLKNKEDLSFQGEYGTLSIPFHNIAGFYAKGKYMDKEDVNEMRGKNAKS